MKVCQKLAALSVNAMSAEQQSQLVNMASATFSRGWCTAITSVHGLMPTMKILVSLINGGKNWPITVTVLVDTGAILCIINSAALEKIAYRSELKKSSAVIGLLTRPMN